MRNRCSVCVDCGQTIVDSEVLGSGKCEERSGCEGERMIICINISPTIPGPV